MTTYAEAATGGKPPRASGVCACSGCCMPGTMTSSTTGTHDWYCRLHFGAPSTEWDSITARAANRRGLLAIALDLSRCPPGHTVKSADQDRIRTLRRPDLLAAGIKTARALGAHMLRVLTQECRAPQSHIETRQSSTSWLDAAHPEGSEV